MESEGRPNFSVITGFATPSGTWSMEGNTVEEGAIAAALRAILGGGGGATRAISGSGARTGSGVRTRLRVGAGGSISRVRTALRCGPSGNGWTYDTFGGNG